MRRVIVYNHVTEVLIIYAKTYGDGQIPKIRMYILISRFYSNRENLCSRNIHVLQYALLKASVIVTKR